MGPNTRGEPDMVQPTPHALAALYEADETAWLEQTAALVRARRFDHLDPDTLAEYLTDMAKRDRREVFSRLVVLLSHLLKWDYQPGRRGSSWRTTIFDQRLELGQIVESGTLRAHAETELARAYAAARKRAADETELPLSTFPADCPWDLDAALGEAGA